MNQTTQNELLRKYPYHLPVNVAAQYLGVSPRRLTQLIAEGRRPFSMGRRRDHSDKGPRPIP